MHGAVAASSEQINGAGHTLEIHLPDQPLFVEGDPLRLTQALSNIVSNAAKFSPRAGLISLEVASADGSATITVRDCGQGITADFLPHVFELFAQQDRSPGRKPGGLGVGLTLARRIARLHDGNVEAFSDGSGKGARFVLSLPLADPGRSVDEPSPRSSPCSPQ
ncbi:MAG: ATP-binding protein [Pseudomonadota bacterium]|nr:ATP-binding protein [Pseudomonadota bacterium]